MPDQSHHSTVLLPPLGKRDAARHPETRRVSRDSAHDVKLKNGLGAGGSSYQCAWKPHSISAPFPPGPSLHVSARTSFSAAQNGPAARASSAPEVLRGRGGAGEGAAAPPARDWSRAPPRGRVGGLLGGSGSGARPASLRSYLGTQRVHPRAASKAFHKCTPGAVTRGPRAHPRILRPFRALPRADLGPRPVHPAATWEPRGPAHPAGTSARSPAHPSSPGSLRPPRSGAGSRRGASTEPAHCYLRRPPGRCRGRSSRARPPRAVACRPRRPPRAGRWVRGGPVAGACPRTRGVGGKRAPRLQPRDLAMLGPKPPRAFYTPAPCRSQSCVSPGPAPFPREARTLYAPGP